MPVMKSSPRRSASRRSPRKSSAPTVEPGLDFDADDVAGSVLEHRVDLELALVTIVRQLGWLRGPGELAGQLRQDERFEQRPERRARAQKCSGVNGDFVGGDARVDEDELGCSRGSGAGIA